MSGDGGTFGEHDIRYFDGGLFMDDKAYELTAEDLGILARAATLNWGGIEPAVFGTLFERSVDPSKRGQIGAHYTKQEDIVTIVTPVLMEPLRRQWDEKRQRATEIIDRAKSQRKAGKTKSQFPRDHLAAAIQLHSSAPSQSHLGFEERDDNNVPLTIKANRNCL